MGQDEHENSLVRMEVESIESALDTTLQAESISFLPFTYPNSFTISVKIFGSNRGTDH